MTDVLEGVRVVELSTVITAPLTGLMLADLGAEVIKVEPPTGDPFRNFRGERYSPNFVAYNRGKRSIALDLRTDAGRAILLELIARADVLLENYRPGIMERLGLVGRRAQGHECPVDRLLDHRLRRDRALQRAAGLRQCGGGAERDREPASRSRASAIERADDRRQCHRHVRPPTASSARCTSASAAATAAGSTSTCWRRASPSSPIRSRTTRAPESRATG